MKIRLFVFVVAVSLFAALTAFAQQSPAAAGTAAKKPRPVAKMTEDDLRAIAAEEVKKSEEESKKALDEVKKQADEAIRKAEEAKLRAAEEAAKAIAEARRTAEEARQSAAGLVKAAVEENNHRLEAMMREREENGPGWLLPAGWVLRPHADLMIRGEFRTNNGDFRGALDDRDQQTGQHVELGLDAAYLDRIRAAVVVQDVRVWGFEGLQTTRAMKGAGGALGASIPDIERFNALYTGAYGTSLSEGWVQLGNFGDVPLTLKAGRMKLFYGEGRVVGSDDWMFSSVRFDAAQVRYTGASWWLELMTAKPRERELIQLTTPSGTVQTYDTPGDDLMGLYLATRWVPGARLDLYTFFNRQGPYPANLTGDDLLIATPGARLGGDAGSMTYDLELAGQFGSNRGKDHTAFAADATVGFEFDAAGEPGISVQYSFATGDKGDNSSSQFLEFYPDHGVRFGLLGMTGWSNINHIRAGGDLMPLDGLLVSLDWRYFMLASSRGWWADAGGVIRGWDHNGTQGRQLGWEVDLKADYDCNAWLNLQAGYGVFVPLGYIANYDPDGSGPLPAYGADPAHFGYVMLSFSLDGAVKPRATIHEPRAAAPVVQSAPPPPPPPAAPVYPPPPQYAPPPPATQAPVQPAYAPPAPPAYVPPPQIAPQPPQAATAPSQVVPAPQAVPPAPQLYPPPPQAVPPAPPPASPPAAPPAWQNPLYQPQPAPAPVPGQ